MILTGAMFLALHGVAQQLPYQDASRPVEQRVQDLLNRMTLEEKIAELNLVPYYASNDSALRAGIRGGRIGAFLKANGAALNRSLQEEALKHSRLGIPLMFHEDVIHGYRTLTPIPLAEACSWDTALVRRSAETAAAEAAASGIHLTYAPMVDISNDPRWGRIMETSGEDAFLGAAMSAARVRGFQGADLSDGSHLAACVKHFAGYGALLAGRDYQNTDFSLRDLRERYLPPFQAAVDAGVASVMCSYTSFDGEPLTMNRFMNTDVLRGEMGFRGLLMSDWTTLSYAVSEGAAADGMESSRRGLESGLDMDMSSWNYSRHLKRLVETGQVDREWVDRSAARALELKFRMGLFDNPYAYFDTRREKRVVGSSEVRRAAFDMACASMVLLKNERAVLPLAPDRKVALVGPFAEMQKDLLGSWTMMGKADEVVTVAVGMDRRMKASCLLKAGCKLDFSETDVERMVAAARAADVIVACVGESAGRIGEAVTTGSLSLPAAQLRLLGELKNTGKPVVAVLFNGRPLVLGDVLDRCDALLEAWYPGTMGGEAVAAVLTGEYNPSGKLVQTFPRAEGQVPLAYNFRRTFGYVHHRDMESGPQFPFGFGLSYTTFRYDAPRVNRTEFCRNDTVEVTVRVTNTGKVAGREIVQLYVRDEVATVVPRERELKGFLPVDLKPGESREVKFRLPSRLFMMYDNRMKWVLEPGYFRIQTGGASDSLKEVRIRFF